MDAAVMFFIVGAGARPMRSDLRIPAPLYEALSIYLLQSIGLNGGTELAKQDPMAILPKALAVITLGATIPHESSMPLLLVLLEVPGIVVGVLLARSGSSSRGASSFTKCCSARASSCSSAACSSAGPLARRGSSR